MNKKGQTSGHDPTLCWDCAFATKPLRCEWVADGTPVNGWVAKESLVSKRSYPYTSYHIISCPKFRRDAYCGGLKKSDRYASTKMDNADVQSLAEAIVEQQVLDWKTIDFGEMESYAHSGNYIKRSEIIQFFNSKWCAQLMSVFTSVTPEQVREKLGIPTLVES